MVVKRLVKRAYAPHFSWWANADSWAAYVPTVISRKAQHWRMSFIGHRQHVTASSSYQLSLVTCPAVLCRLFFGLFLTRQAVFMLPVVWGTQFEEWICTPNYKTHESA